MFREEVINTRLADVLSEFGLNTLPETIDMTTGSKKYPDVSTLVEGIKVTIEGRKETYQKDKLMEDAKRRIEEDIADVSIALLYPKEIEEQEATDKLIEFLKKCKYNGAIFYSTDGNVKEEKFENITIELLAQILKNVTALIISKQKISEYVKEVENKFTNISQILASANLFYSNNTLLKTITDLLEIEQESVSKKQEKDLYQMLLFILFDAMLMHESIANINITSQITIKGLSSASSPLKDFFIDEWKKILKIDYEPVFAVAFQLMTNLPSSPEIEKTLETLKQLATKVLSSGILRKHDFLGRLYHKILLKTTGRFYATYYTAIPSAILLSGLLFKTYHKGWKFDDLKDLDNFKVIDPACGSGTLLSASYTALMDLYSRSLGPSEFDKFHEKVIGNCLYGWDVLDYASHLTLTTLAMHNPRTLVKKSNIYTLPIGVENETAYLGSLSYLRSVLFGKSWIQQGTDAKRSVKIEEQPHSFDVVIMNPPFTRSTGFNVKFGYISDEDRKKLNNELKNIINEFKLQGIGQAGLGVLFIYLGHKLLKNNGRMGIVIPRNILTGVSSEKIRRLLMDNYEIKYIISNHDAGDDSKGVESWSWSENTDLCEVMLILEKKGNESKQETTYINLWNKPANDIESYLLVAQIIKEYKNLSGYLKDGIYKVLEIAGSGVGAFYKVKQKELEDYGWLAPCLFASPDLNKLTVEIVSYLREHKAQTLADIADHMGADRKQIEDYFEKTSNDNQYPIIWGHDISISTLMIDSKYIGYGNPVKKGADSFFAKNKAKIFISENIHLHNTRLICISTDLEAIATTFWEIKLKDEKLNPLLLLWFNSTYGAIVYLANSISSVGDDFMIKKGQLGNLLIPYPCKKVLQLSSEMYEKIKDREFLTLKEEFSLASHGQGTRKMIDDFFRDNFKLPDLTPYYKILAREPIFTLKRLIVNTQNIP
jgi:hypothetical protein